MGMEFGDLIALRDRLEELKEDSYKITEACTKDVTARVLSLAIKRTKEGHKPVFNSPKRQKVKVQQTYKKGNQIKVRTTTRSFLTKEGEILEKYWSGYQGGTLRRGWAVKPPVNENGACKMEIFNPIEYASYVEYGHRQTPGRYVPALGKRLKVSWVPGQFMLTKSVEEVRSKVDVIVRRKLEKMLKGYVNG